MSAVCAIDGCERPVFVKERGWCGLHYGRWHRHGDPLKVLPRGGARVMPPRAKTVRPPCRFPGCERLSAKSCKGWCPMHHTRWYRHGDPSIIGRGGQKTTPLRARFIAKVEKADTGCWEWRAARRGNGYGVIGGPRDIGLRYAHRVAWELFRGPVPDGMEIHHVCGNRSCVNPDHLQALTRADHMRAHRSAA